MLFQLELEIVAVRLVQLLDLEFQVLVPLCLVFHLPFVLGLQLIDLLLVDLLLFGQMVAFLLILGVEERFHFLFLLGDFFH